MLRRHQEARRARAIREGIRHGLALPMRELGAPAPESAPTYDDDTPYASPWPWPFVLAAGVVGGVVLTLGVRYVLDETK